MPRYSARPMMSTEILLLGAMLIAVTGVVQAASVAFSLPQTFVVSFVGILFGALFLAMHAWLPEPALAFVDPVVAWPLSADMCLTLFLPPLLFQAALSVEIREMLGDWLPILILAIIGVFVATVSIGFVASWTTNVPARDGLLLGAIIATTDASAVLAVFRSVTAPSRLVRLVEGESLLNDAAAISIATVLLEASRSADSVSRTVAEISQIFATEFGGGAILGMVVGRMLAWGLVHLGGEGKAELTLTLAVPYPLYILGNEFFHVSGVVAVVTAGLVISGLGRARLTPRNWSHLQLMWEQVAGIAGTLVFLLATIRVPGLLRAARASDALALGAIIIAALAARLAVLFGVFPSVSRLGLSNTVTRSFRLVITWGGLRGAVTIILALGIEGNAALPEPTRRLVSVLATGFVLFSLAVNGSTLRPLIRFLGLDHLSPQDMALQERAVGIAGAEIDALVRASARSLRIDPNLACDAIDAYHDSTSLDNFLRSDDIATTDEDRLTAGLLALARREGDLIPRYGNGIVAVENLDRMIANAAAMTEAVRRGGRAAYRQAAAQILQIRWSYRAARWIHSWLKLSWPFSCALQNRFELLICRRAVLEQLHRYTETSLQPLLGPETTKTLSAILHGRMDRTEHAITEMRGDFGHYTRKLERRMLLLVALNAGRDRVEHLYRDQSISSEVYESVSRDFMRAWRNAIERPEFSADDE
ncbi:MULTISPECIES: sodium:proton antiporter [unclassified Burkholderia]|uniref:cation:proton antiporter n=1 Tax=unclassified Burkholderia TaxID=2613784 RepID=UPI000AE9048A|nr:MULTISPECIES: sodium:proton antiporter [unclassified Burkholderia]